MLDRCHHCVRMICSLRKNSFFICDAYSFIFVAVLVGLLANFCGLYDILLFEKSFPAEFTWPPRVFDHSTYEEYQKTSENRRIDYYEFSSSLVSSLEEWKLNSAFWKLEQGEGDEPASFAPGMMSLVGQIPLVRRHIQYLQAITRPVPDFPAPTACRNSASSGALRTGLLILVKSAITHVARRNAIRQTWAAGSAHRSSRKNGPSYEVMFVLGVSGGVGVSGTGEFSYRHQADLMEEQNRHGDIIQTQFVDTYFNNTAKTISGIHYLFNDCPILDPRNGFLFLTDDDMMVNVKNLEALTESIKQERDTQSVPRDIYLGYRFPGSKPKRWRWSKWYISTDEYPCSWYPPYITAAGVLLSKDTAEKFFYASHFIPLFRFDDIYLAIIAHMLDVESEHRGDAFFFEHLPLVDGNAGLYRDSVIAVHGYHDPALMISAYRKLEQITAKALINL
ncbi:putative Beta-1,3-galactosyltransferase brn [Hypsibius exemplaris]|uniref:Hexosyltransferase n=1 Tax=Hypsibius exemplaris TaxID=2072580 RepID=A0A1W0WTW1_HYPEX|nr:putative Beta-1,3-galactosyltransferase brn [Hypsibius exemplaris]